MSSMHLSFKDFVFKFDVVTGDISKEENYSERFLEYLSSPKRNYCLDTRYKLVFPLFYDFKLTPNSPPVLFKDSDSPYHWWIDPSIENAVRKHSDYGLGITESYCKSDVGPSFLEISRAQNGDIKLGIRLYDSFTPDDAYLNLEEISEPKEDKRKITEAKSEKKQDFGELKHVKVVFENTDEDIKRKLEKNEDFLKGIISHYPIINEDNKFLYYFFSNNLTFSEENKYGFGGLFIIADRQLENHELGFFMLAGYTLSNKIAQSQLQHTARTEATKSAIAKAMTRNMSHNIGSHVLSSIIKDDIYKELCDAKVSDLKCYKSELPVIKDNKVDLQLSYFFRYLKSRMDYLSEVTFCVPDMVQSRMIYEDVMKEMDRVRILMNHISGITDFNYRFDLIYEDKPMRDNDIAAAFPGDVLGCQAFFNIIENIIRNTAKHSRYEGEVTFTIQFKEIDNCGDVSGANELYCVEINNGVKEKNINEIVQKQNIWLNESILDVSNNLRNHSLGLLEMEASAAFLRQIDLQDIESDNFEVDNDLSYYHTRNGVKRLNIIKAFNADGALGYRFFLLKPKEFIFVGDDWSLDGNQEDDRQKKLQLLKYAGIEFMKCGEFKSALDSGTAFAHQFLIYDSTLAAEILSKTDYMTLLPLRQILVDDKDMMAVTDMLKRDVNKAIESLKEFSWGKIVKASRTQDVVAFFNHGNGGLKAFYRQYTESGKCIENILSNTQGKYPRFSTFSSCKSKDGKPWTAYLGNIPEQIRKEICEAYESKVIIIDERVQRFAEDGFEGAIPCWALFRSTKVSIPRCHVTDSNGQNVAPKIMGVDPVSKEVKFVDMPAAQAEMEVIPLGTKDLADYRDKLEGYIKKRIRNSCLIIHYGILERLYGRNKDDIKKMLENWAACARRVIVTSGRGAHSLDLPDTVCFASLSSVLYACTENRNKFIINNLINQARRKRK